MLDRSPTRGRTARALSTTPVVPRSTVRLHRSTRARPMMRARHRTLARSSPRTGSRRCPRATPATSSLAVQALARRARRPLDVGASPPFAPPHRGDVRILAWKTRFGRGRAEECSARTALALERDFHGHRPKEDLLRSSTSIVWLPVFGFVGLLLLGVGTTGCVEREVVVREPARACAGGVWIEGYRGRRGRWHPGHWRCPGVVEVVEVD
jgi:hypothetical protein